MGQRVFNIAEAKTHLSKIIELVEQGEDVTIARNNKPVAVISRPRKPVQEIMEDVRALRESIRARNGGRNFLEPGETWREVIHEGHRI